MEEPAPIQYFGLKFQDWTDPQLLVTDSADNLVYTGRMSASEPQVTLQAAGQQGDIATATLPDVYHGAEISVRGRAFSIEKEGDLHTKHHFVTAAGARLTWIGQGRHMRCFDANDQVVAKVGRAGWSGRRRTLEIAGGSEEILFTAVVMIMRERGQNKSGALSK